MVIGISTSSCHSLWSSALFPSSSGSCKWSRVSYCSSDKCTTPHTKFCFMFCSTIGLSICHSFHLSGECRSICFQSVLGGSAIFLLAMVTGVSDGFSFARNLFTIIFRLSGCLTWTYHGRGGIPLLKDLTTSSSCWRVCSRGSASAFCWALILSKCAASCSSLCSLWAGVSSICWISRL